MGISMPYFNYIFELDKSKMHSVKLLRTVLSNGVLSTIFNVIKRIMLSMQYARQAFVENCVPLHFRNECITKTQVTGKYTRSFDIYWIFIEVFITTLILWCVFLIARISRSVRTIPLKYVLTHYIIACLSLSYLSVLQVIFCMSSDITSRIQRTTTLTYLYIFF